MGDSDDDVPLNVSLKKKVASGSRNQDDFDEESDEDIPLGKINGRSKSSNGQRAKRNVKKVSYKEEDGEDEDSDDMILTATPKKASKASTTNNSKKRKASAISQKSNGKGKKKNPKKEEEEEEEEDEDDDDDDDDDDIPLSSSTKKRKTTTTTTTKKKTASTAGRGKTSTSKTGKGKGKGTKATSNGKGKKTTTTTARGKGKKESSSSTKSKTGKSKSSKQGVDKLEATEKVIFSKKAERIEQAIKSFKWWDAEPLADGIQWKKLEHNGMSFPPDYKCHGVTFTYDGIPVAGRMKIEEKGDDNHDKVKKEEMMEVIKEEKKSHDAKTKTTPLPADIEEIATFFAGFPADGPQLGNPEVAPTFIKNFFEEFKKVTNNRCASKLTGEPLAILKYEKCNFDAIKNHLDIAKQVKKAATDVEKERLKMEKTQLQDKFGYALLDNRIEKVGNYNMEPPGLFRGRGLHPKCGMLKKRAMPEQVTINIGPYAKAPICPIPGHAWGSIQHDNRVTWMSSWKENVLEGNKYVQMAASGSFKGKSDMEKYDKAARLKDYIGKIRSDYEKALTSKDRELKQRATAMWIIDKLALRVGGEKGEDEADTVGCCSLRKEHFTFPPNAESLYASTKGKSSTALSSSTSSSSAPMDLNVNYEAELEFLGKDSMLFKQTIDFSVYDVHGIQVWKNLYAFTKSKKESDEVFETLTPTILNQHLSSLMPGLSAKVFRTYNASETLQNELPTTESMRGMLERDKVVAYNEANRKVAILCNHQRTASKAIETSIDGLKDKLKLYKKQKKEIANWKELIKTKKGAKSIPLKTNEKEKAMADKVAKATKTAEDKKKIALSNEEKVEATTLMEKAKTLKKELASEKLKSAHMYVNEPTPDQVAKKLDTWTEKIKKLELDIRNKDENKEVALGTSKINYMDPRISVAWCKRNEVSIEKIFAKTLRDKFVWAMSVPPTWRFEGEKTKNMQNNYNKIRGTSSSTSTSVTSTSTGTKVKKSEKITNSSSKDTVKVEKNQEEESDDDIPLAKLK